MAALELGEAFAGEGAEAAHLNTVLGRKGTGVETAWATALATPTSGHARFVVVLQPGLPVKPPTLFVPKAELHDARHAEMTWGPAQVGVAEGVVDALRAGVLPSDEVDDLMLIAAVWVDPKARDADAVRENNRAATLGALQGGAAGTPDVADLLESGGGWNPFHRSPADRPR